MAYFSARTSSFDPDQNQFGDDLVGRVYLRAPVSRHHSHLAEKKSMWAKTTREVSSSDDTNDECYQKEPANESITDDKTESEDANFQIRVTRTRRSTSRREQCRRNQARYRKRLQHNELQLNENIRRLQKEVGRLKTKYENIRPYRKSKRSPWAIVTDVFQLVDESISRWCMAGVVNKRNDLSVEMFLQECFAPNVTMGDHSGVNALMEQFQHYAQNFGNPKVQFQRIESVAPGIILATGRLQATVTELSLRKVFPNLPKGARLDMKGNSTTLHERILGQSVGCSWTATFFFDEDHGRVERLHVSFDLVNSLLQAFGRLEDLANALTP